MQHPWYLKPLPPQFDQALKKLAGEQAAIDAQVSMDGVMADVCVTGRTCLAHSS
jgi:hypothetical protein